MPESAIEGIMANILSFFLQGAAIGISAGASPGPLQALLLSETLSGGWKRGLPVTLAPLITDAPIILLSLVLLDQVPPIFLRIVSLAGGVLLLYLAWGNWKQVRTSDDSVQDEPQNSGGLKKAILMNWLSPHPYIFWTLVNGPILLSGLRQSTLHGGAFLFGFYGIFTGLMALMVLFFSQIRRMGPRVNRGLIIVSMAALVVFAGILLKQGIWP
jgi:threonine/homoserine/homoserine lactone efflux protein